MSLKAGDWAAWVQAVGSIAAICAGFGTAYYQSWKANDLRNKDRVERERDRADRAEVVAFRLSGWLGEVGSRVGVRLKSYDDIRKRNPMPQPDAVLEQLKLDMAVGIEGVMADLHYLKAGSGDIAQLDFLVRLFNAFLDQAYTRGSLTEEDLVDFYDRAKLQLKSIKQVHANAERHLKPIVEAAARKER